MKTKTFDCVQMKRRGAELVRKQLEGKSLKQQLEFWKKGTSQLKGLQKNQEKRDSLLDTTPIEAINLLNQIKNEIDGN